MGPGTYLCAGGEGFGAGCDWQGDMPAELSVECAPCRIEYMAATPTCY
jgi:hypothetical protein